LPSPSYLVGVTSAMGLRNNIRNKSRYLSLFAWLRRKIGQNIQDTDFKSDMFRINKDSRSIGESGMKKEGIYSPLYFS
jgi:hypothetical protein